MLSCATNLWLLLLISEIISETNSSTPAPTITLSHGGRVRGATEEVTFRDQKKNVDYFLGIPFAKPPVKELRFASPENHKGWDGIRDAVTLPPTCWQYIFTGFDIANNGARMWVNNTEMSEDCLYLNVWMPSGKMNANLPVMVWIYGGGYTSGTSTLDVYNGKFLAAKHDVIVVSMQYRLGAFGFLRIDPKPTRFNRESDGSTKLALGNMGLKDQLLALEWVQKEIKNFGGNPRQVTVFGESSGAVSVTALWTSPKTKALFRRAIVQSGSIFARWGLHDLKVANHRAAVFSKACNCPDPSVDPSTSIKCLQNVDPMVLVNTLDAVIEDDAVQRNNTMWENFFHKFSASEFGNGPFPGWATSSRRYFEVPFAAVIDGDFLPNHPRNILKSPNYTRESPELLIGVNQNEAIYFILYGLAMQETMFLKEDGNIVLPESIKKAGLREPRRSDGQKADFRWITALEFLDKRFLIPGLAAAPATFYGLPMSFNTTQEYAYPYDIKLAGEEVMKRISDLASDADFICPTLEFAEMASRQSNAKVYLYYFQQMSSRLPWPTWVGAMHGYEIPFVFGIPYSKEFTKEFYGFTSEETEFGDKMQQLWVNFAKYGDPNLPVTDQYSTKWPLYKSNAISEKQPDQWDHYILDVNMRPGSRLREKECGFWLHFMDAYQREVLDGAMPIFPANRTGLVLLWICILRITVLLY
ncbi:Cholinesterase [Fasciola gigantica]|uniref:Carboxylic ester hydrolase n=1 Tax=Fasciola gigantica TaxID=46835 RepID=A0A504YZP0_FASGI|nr:Cholinesterase [Fasciola gigantica]